MRVKETIPMYAHMKSISRRISKKETNDGK